MTDWQAPPMIKKAVSNSAELPASCSGSPRDAASVELSSAGAGFSLMPLPLSPVTPISINPLVDQTQFGWYQSVVGVLAG